MYKNVPNQKCPNCGKFFTSGPAVYMKVYKHMRWHCKNTKQQRRGVIPASHPVTNDQG